MHTQPLTCQRAPSVTKYLKKYSELNAHFISPEPPTCEPITCKLLLLHLLVILQTFSIMLGSKLLPIVQELCPACLFCVQGPLHTSGSPCPPFLALFLILLLVLRAAAEARTSIFFLTHAIRSAAF